MTGLKPLAAPANARPDPILAVIEVHRRAWDDLGECSVLDQTASAGDKKAARKLKRLETAVADAQDKLVDIPPRRSQARQRCSHTLPILRATTMAKAGRTARLGPTGANIPGK